MSSINVKVGDDVVGTLTDFQAELSREGLLPYTLHSFDFGQLAAPAMGPVTINITWLAPPPRRRCHGSRNRKK
jgi:hypothetical protein